VVVGVLALATFAHGLAPQSAGAASAAKPATARVEPAATIRASRGHLVLGGKPYRTVGLNAYELPTLWGSNAGCGAMLSNTQLGAFFAAMPAHSLVRIWAWQGSMATQFRTKKLDWGPLDRVVRAAAAHHDFLVMSLAGQSGSCDDGHWKGPQWYSGGYQHAYDDDDRALAPLSYATYVHDIVTRYASSPAVGMWELVNEPEASSCAAGFSGDACYGHTSCSDERAAAAAMRSFFDTEGGAVHHIDRHHLVEAGFLGSGQCGTAGTDYAFVGRSAGIDVLSYHDYYPAGVALGGDQWNGIAVRLRQAAALDKPIIAGEMGVDGGSAAACASLSERVKEVRAKAAAQLARGSDAILLWDWEPRPTAPCDYSTYPGDPLVHLIGTH
jgi:hypothetical protein